MSELLSTEEKILAAARAEFLEKGYNGARMEAIARRADINKALLHYYFRNKERLFEEVFAYFFDQLLPALRMVVESQAPILDKIEQFIHHYIDFIKRNPDMPAFLINELRTSPTERLQAVIDKKQAEFGHIRLFAMQIAMAGANGEIKPVPPIHIVLNVLSMCVFPFVAKPMFTNVFKIDDDSFNELMEQRKEVVSAFVRTALTPDAD